MNLNLNRKLLLFPRQQVQVILQRNKVESFLNLSVIEITREGSSTPRTVSIDYILGKLKRKLPLRDLRILSKGQRNQFCILPRPQAGSIILEIETIRLICLRDSCLLLQHNSKLNKQFLSQLLTSISMVSRPTDPNLKSRPENCSEEKEDNFEFEQKVLESALSVTVAKFQRHINLLTPAVDLLLQQITADPNSAMLRRLLAVKKSLSDFESNVNNLSRILQTLLGNDEDLVGLYLTDTHRKLNQHEEVELLLECYLADLEDIQSQIKTIKDTIEDTNQFIGAHLDATRNRMIRMGLYIDMGMLSLGSGALIAGIFGMNLTHGLETHPTAFYLTCGGMSTLMLAIFTKFRSNYKKLRFDTTSAYSFKVLKNFLTYVDDLEDVVSTSDHEITETQFKAALEKLAGQKVPAEEAEFLFQMFDQNKDRKISTSTELKL